METDHLPGPRFSWMGVLALNSYWVGLSFMWTALHVIVLPAVLLRFVSNDLKNTALGLLTFAGLMIAMVIQPLSGAISDRWRSRWGRRRPLIVLGTTLDLAFLGMMALSGDLVLLAIGYIGLQFTSNVAHGPAQGLMHDRVPSARMGVASGVKNFLDMAGMVIASLWVGRLLSPDGTNAGQVIVLVGCLLVAGALVTVLGVREASSRPDLTQGASPLSLKESLRIDWRAHPAYWRLIASRLLFLIGIYGIQSFAQYYVRDTLPTDNPVQLTGDLLAAIVLSLIAFSIISGGLCDRFGRKRMHYAAAALVVLGSVLMLAARTPGAVLAFGSIVGAGVGIFTTANWALANDLAPVGEAGKFLGLTNIATAGAAALSRLEGPAIDALNAYQSGAHLGYAFLFGGAAIFALASLGALRRVPEPIAGAAPRRQQTL